MLFDVIRALGRRWYVLVAGLLITAAMAYGAFALSPPVYTARALVLLLPSKSSVPDGANPFLALSDLDLPARLIVAYFQSAPARAEVEARSPDAEYDIAIEESTRGPVIAVDVTDVTPAGTLATLQDLVDRLPVQLARMQRDVDVPFEATVTSMPFAVDVEAEEDASGTLRLVLAAAAVGIVVTGATAFAVDGLVLRRRARRGSFALTGEPGETVPDDKAPDHKPLAARLQSAR